MTKDELKNKIRCIVTEKEVITYESFNIIEGRMNGQFYVIFFLKFRDSMGYIVTVDNNENPHSSYIECFFGLTSILKHFK